MVDSTRDQKLTELAATQAKLHSLQDELAVINAKAKQNEPLTEADKSFIGNLGWLTTLSVSIAAIAASLS